MNRPDAPPATPASTERRATDLFEWLAHEFRTPLTSILGFAELLLEAPESGRGALGEQQRFEQLRAIQRNGRQLLELIGDLSDLAKLEDGRLALTPAEVQPYELIQEVAIGQRFHAERRGINLSCTFQWPFPSRVRLDGARLRQVVETLVAEALRLTEKGDVALRASYLQEGGEGRLQLQVEDSSPGLSPEERAKLFEPFYLGGPRGGGSGLGLAVARGLIQALGGRIEVHSQRAVGNHWMLDLPLGPAANLELLPREPVLIGTALPAPLGPTPRLKGRVLVIEDGRDTQRLILELLARAGTEVRTAGNGIEALEALFPRRGRRRGERTNDSPPLTFDLILTDVEMPGMDGPTLVAELRRRGMTLPIVALTAHDTDGLRERLLALGCNEVLHKPLDRTSFYGTVQRWMPRAA